MPILILLYNDYNNWHGVNKKFSINLVNLLFGVARKHMLQLQTLMS